MAKYEESKAVDIQHRGAAVLRKRLEGMTPEQVREFWEEKAKELEARRDTAKARRQIEKTQAK